MSFEGIIFNNRHSYNDMGITMTGERSIGYPKKRKTKVTPPFSNIAHDFSEIYGDQVYEERPLRYQFNLINFDELDVQSVDHLSTKIVNWLMNSNGKQKLIDPYIPYYYFMAEVEGDIDLERFTTHGILDVNFVGYPFKISELNEGNDIWDSFNFDLDVAQRTDFSVNGTEEIILINPGTPSIVPTINASAPFIIVKDSIEYSFQSGTTQNDRFRLFSGENKLLVKGNGRIEFNFHKELI